MMHQEHVGVKRFWDEVTAEFHGVDVLPREYPPNSNTYGDGDDHRHDDVIITRHLKDHGDRGHRRSGPAANHRRHTNYRERRNTQVGQRENRSREGTESASESGTHKERGGENASGSTRTEAQECGN